MSKAYGSSPEIDDKNGELRKERKERFIQEAYQQVRNYEERAGVESLPIGNSGEKYLKHLVTAGVNKLENEDVLDSPEYEARAIDSLERVVQTAIEETNTMVGQRKLTEAVIRKAYEKLYCRIYPFC